MEKKYIIKDARNTLAHQLETTGITEKTPMSESPITNARGRSAAIPKDSEASSLFTTTLRRQAVSGIVRLTATFWKSTIAAKDGRGAAY